MTGLLWFLAIAAFLRWSFLAVALRRGWAGRPRLDEIAPGGPEPLPSLSVVLAARDEEAEVEPAMRSLLAQEYDLLEIVAVDDRSTDRTGEILARLAAESPRLRVLRVNDLPSGWLGKTHALHLGSRSASGEWILFTDADVRFDPTALRRAVRYASDQGVDHLVVLPEIDVRGFWERLFNAFFWVIFALRSRPSKVSDPRSRASVGVGAFNLVRAEAYRAMGGHEALALQILDDLRLGRRMKESGARQDCLSSGGLVRVRWALGMGGAVEGLTKNLFAVLEYRPLLLVLASVAGFLGIVWPGAGLFVGPAGARLLCAGTLAMMALALHLSPGSRSTSPLYGLGFPAAALVFLYALYRSMILTYARGGVVWRGTHYPLSLLRKGTG